VLRQPYVPSVRAYLEAEGDQFGHVIVSRRDVALMHLPAVRDLCPNARVIFDTVDLHFIREMRQQAVETEAAGPAGHVAANRAREIELIEMSDVTLVVSPWERDELQRLLPGVDVRVVSNIHAVTPTPRAFADRAGVLFVGYFVHTPNADAVRWFVREVLPRVRIADPRFCVHIVGSDPPDDIVAMASDTVRIHGYVASLDALFDECRLSIAPLRYGAGVKGKIGQSLALGVPCVTTSIGAEGMGLEDGVSAMIADTAEAFAAKLQRAYDDEELWLTLRHGGLSVIQDTMSVDAASKELRRLLAVRDLEPVAF
jgi:glycosyltransferase involved in cell wall biosynthesis